jgi:hypothetical protein
METTKDVSQGVSGEQADMMFRVIGWLVRQAGGQVTIPLEAFYDAGGFTTDAQPDGLIITAVTEMPMERVQ